MEVGALVVIAVALALVVALLAAPLRARGAPAADEAADRIAELEARKEAKYREIRDAELDLRTGKLSADDHAALDARLRAEAIAILRALDDERGALG